MSQITKADKEERRRRLRILKERCGSKGKISVTDILRRLTGFSTPLIGLSWQPTRSQKALARKLFRFLEDRRVLYNPCSIEYPEYTVLSVLLIRKFIREILTEESCSEELQNHLQGMLAACRKFLDTVHDKGKVIITKYTYDPHSNTRNLGFRFVHDTAIGELRGVFGMHIAAIAAKHDIEINGKITSIVPTKIKDYNEVEPDKYDRHYRN